VIAVGGKAEGLIRLRDEFGMPVPPFLVVPFAEVIANFSDLHNRLAEAISHYFADGDEDNLTKTLGSVSIVLDETTLQQISKEVRSQAWEKVSFRTSALAEDGPFASFAGQYESFLDVQYSEDELRAKARACFESMLSLRVLRYAKNRGLKRFDLGGSFIIQEMFYGTSSGVLFTETGSGSLGLQFSSSWRNTVVEGDDAKELSVPRGSIESAAIPEEIRRLCTLALELEALVGYPLDIEFSVKANQVMFLQMRPITVPNLSYSFDWDSTNISENYPGVTLPLTYSVIRELYAGVYKSFLRLLGTPEKLLQADETAFRNMLGHLNGNVYYRITNWYELLKFLPGRANQEFFEAMLNPVIKKGERKNRPRMDAKSLWTLIRFLWLLSRSEAKSELFRNKFSKRLAFFKSYHYEHVNVAELLDASKKVRNELLSEWAVPILNDVKLMVFHGILKRYFFASEDQTEYLAFLQGLTDRASLKPLEQLSHVGKTIAEAMQIENVSSIEELKATPSWVEVTRSANLYVTAFGSRTPGELKLESIRLTDDLDDVLAMALKAHESSFGLYAKAHAIEDEEVPQLAWPKHIKTYQRPILRWVANNTRKAIDWRERFRFNRAQTFDLSRSMYDAVGKVLTAENLISECRDIYWLTESEIDEIVNGHAWNLDAKNLVSSRKELFDSYSQNKMSLAVKGGGVIAPAQLSPVLPLNSVDGLAGKGVAPGVLTAKVIICTEFDPTVDVRGKILVVHHIDPGWTLLFTQAAGIVAERGNALSHAAIIAREIGIPAVVAAPDVTSILQSGEIITINGITGSIIRESN
jgi:pyruvate,water dikinase